MTDAPPVRRRLLGAALRRYREDAGFSVDDAANILECDPSKISRIETGSRGIRPKELRELLTEYDVDESQRNALVAIARQTGRRGWWQSYGEVLLDAYQDYIILESTATAIWSYEAQLIPGLLQTEDYARAIADASVIFETREQQDTIVEVRLARQQILTQDDPPQLWAILSEASLRQMVGGSKVMQAQLRHLAKMSTELPNVTVQVLPFAAGAHAATSSGPFAILKFPEAADLGVVYLEGQTGGVYLESEPDFARYTLVFEHLRASALSTAASMQLISEVARELWQSVGTKSHQAHQSVRSSPLRFGVRALTAGTQVSVSRRRFSARSGGARVAAAVTRATVSRLRSSGRLCGTRVATATLRATVLRLAGGCRGRWRCGTLRILTGRSWSSGGVSGPGLSAGFGAERSASRSYEADFAGCTGSSPYSSCHSRFRNASSVPSSNSAAVNSA